MEGKSHFIECPAYNTPELEGSEPHKMHYLEWGEANDKPSVVAVHGLTRNAHDFDMVAHELVQAGYHLLAVDVVGRGQSAWLKDPYHYGYPLYVADMLHFLDTLKLQQVVWLGTSMGGLMGMMVASQRPKAIAKLILNDIGSFIPGASLMRIGAAVGQNMVYDTREKAYGAMQERMASFGVRERAHWNHLFEHYFFMNKDGHYHCNYDPALGDAFWNKRGKQRSMSDMDLSTLWQAVQCPTLLLRGAESDLLPKETFDAMVAQPHVQGHEFSRCGHAPMLMEDHQIQTILKWI